MDLVRDYTRPVFFLSRYIITKYVNSSLLDTENFASSSGKTAINTDSIEVNFGGIFHPPERVAGDVDALGFAVYAWLVGSQSSMLRYGYGYSMSFFGAALVGAVGYKWRHGARTGLGSSTAEPSVLLPGMMISSSPRLTLSTQVHIHSSSKNLSTASSGIALIKAGLVQEITLRVLVDVFERVQISDAGRGMFLLSYCDA